jgi:hypothetical protein
VNVNDSDVKDLTGRQRKEVMGYEAGVIHSPRSENFHDGMFETLQRSVRDKNAT